MLIWAREQAGYSLEQVAGKLGQPPARLASWERGDTKPTLRQAERLAAVYHRPFTLLYLKAAPATVPLASEYRRLPGVTPGKESPELRLALREMIHRRNTALDLIAELGDEPEPFALRAHLGEEPEAVAARVRTALGISLPTLFAWANEFQAWRAWRAAIERLDVLVFQFAKVDIGEVRGVSLVAFPLPAIGINNREVPASKPFSVLHELVHVILANAAEEKPALEERRSDVAWQQVEGFGERVAGGVLMPRDALVAEPAVRSHAPAQDWEIAEVARLARRYKVTPAALATRLFVLGRMTPGSYRRWKDGWREFLAEHPPRSSGGFAAPAEKALNRNGRSFTLLVLEALSADRITAVDAVNRLSLNYPHIESLRRELVLSREPHLATAGEGV
jgi:Zn-dependent peptidase ImmA (M78 family)/DNA-binding XRE family transcriptional regulator